MLGRFRPVLLTKAVHPQVEPKDQGACPNPAESKSRPLDATIQLTDQRLLMSDRFRKYPPPGILHWTRASPSDITARKLTGDRGWCWAFPDKEGTGVKVVILAGGLGSRLAEEIEVRPKPMVEIGGKPIIWHIMKIYSAHGLHDFIICLGYKVTSSKNTSLNYYLHMSDVTFDMRANSMQVHRANAEPWQRFNLDGAGRGSLETLRINIAAAGFSEDMLSTATNSTACHKLEHTLNDIRLAMQLTRSGRRDLRRRLYQPDVARSARGGGSALPVRPA